MKDSVLSEILKRLKNEFDPIQVYLFGSRAKGYETSDSDYDLLLVVQDSSLSKLERMQKAQEALWGLWEAVDVVIFTQTEFDELRDEPSSLASIALKEGHPIHAA